MQDVWADMVETTRNLTNQNQKLGEELARTQEENKRLKFQKEANEEARRRQRSVHSTSSERTESNSAACAGNAGRAARRQTLGCAAYSQSRQLHAPIKITTFNIAPHSHAVRHIACLSPRLTLQGWDRKQHNARGAE
jgi:hypothetical protein